MRFELACTTYVEGISADGCNEAFCLDYMVVWPWTDRRIGNYRQPELETFGYLGKILKYGMTRPDFDSPRILVLYAQSPRTDDGTIGWINYGTSASREWHETGD